MLPGMLAEDRIVYTVIKNVLVNLVLPFARKALPSLK
jgi:hypothetical protein